MLELRYQCPKNTLGGGLSSFAFVLVPSTIVQRLGPGKLAILGAGRLAMRVAEASLGHGSSSCSTIELAFSDDAGSDAVARQLCKAVEEVCQSLFFPNPVAPCSKAMPFLPAAGTRLACAHMLYAAQPPKDSCRVSVPSNAPMLPIVFTSVFAELCAPIGPASSALGTQLHIVLHWPALRLYADDSREDCLDVIAVGPGSAVEFIAGHPSLILRERLPHIVAFKSAQQAAHWSSLLQALCAFDPMDTKLLKEAASRVQAKASAAEAAATEEAASIDVVPLLRVTDRSPFLPDRSKCRISCES